MPGPLIAVVDDDRFFIDVLNDLLVDEGYQTLCLSQSIDAHTAIKAHAPAVIILDVWLETATAGLDVLSLLRLDPATADIPVILCSARTDLLADNAEYLAAQRCVILQKPFALDELLRLIASFARLPS